MILYFDQRIMSWTSRIRVYDEHHALFCQVQGKLSWAQKYLVSDADGMAIGEVKEKLFSLSACFQLKKGTECLATVQKKGAFRSVYTIDNGWIIDRNGIGWDWSIKKPDGSTAVSLSRQLPGQEGRLGLAIADDVDPLLAIMAVIAVEAERSTTRSRETKQELRAELRDQNKKHSQKQPEKEMKQ